MLARLQTKWRLFERAEPGTRFEKLREARSDSKAARAVATVLGILLLAGGVVLLFVPGPGILLIAFGGGLLAQQSRWLAKRLDELELLLRRIARRGRSLWKRARTPIRVAVASGGVLAVGLAAWAAYLWFFRN